MRATHVPLSVILIVLSHIGQPSSVFAQATTINFTSISITPANSTVGLGSRKTLSATAAFSDGASQSYSAGEWDIFFSPQIDVSPCPPPTQGAPVLASQPVLVASNGSFHQRWGPGLNDVTADGSMTATSFSATLTCTLTGVALGSISANWAGTEFDGTFTVTKNSGSVIIRGITWTSSNPAVATIDVTGAVTGVSPGVTTITATYGAACEKVGGEPPVPTWGCQGTTSGSTTLTVASTNVGSTDDNNDSGPIQSGYAIVTPVSGAPAGGVPAFATFGLKRSDGNTAQAGVLPAAMTTNAFVAVATNTQLQRDLGLAVVNPGTTSANVTLTLRKADGTPVGTKTQTFTPGSHVALFVTQIFSDQSSVLSNFTGTLSIASDNPIAVVGLPFRGAEFSTIPITSLSAAASVPTVSSGVGGSGAVILPDFAEDGGWSTQFSIANPGTAVLTARLDVFDSNGKPLQITLNGVKQSTFNVTVNPNGVVILAPIDGATGQSRF